MVRTSFAAQGVSRALPERFLRRYRRLHWAAFNSRPARRRSLYEKLAERLAEIIAKLPRHCKPPGVANHGHFAGRRAVNYNQPCPDIRTRSLDAHDVV